VLFLRLDKISQGKITSSEADDNFSNDFMLDFTNKFKDISKHERKNF